MYRRSLLSVRCLMTHILVIALASDAVWMLPLDDQPDLIQCDSYEESKPQRTYRQRILRERCWKINTNVNVPVTTTENTLPYDTYSS